MELFASDKFQKEYKMKNLKKIEFFWKKVLTNRLLRGIINKRSRERVENRLDDSAKQKHFVN